MEDNLDMKQIWNMLMENKWIILTSVFLCVSFMTAYLYIFSTPVFKSETQILVNQSVSENTTIQTQDIQADLQLVNTYMSIIESPRILSQVSKNMNGIYSTKELKQMITVNNASGTQMIKINVEGENSKDIIRIANETVEVFQKDISKIMNIDNIYTLSKASSEDVKSHIKPHKALLLVISVVLGGVLGIFIMWIRIIFDRSIKTLEDVEKTLGIPVLSGVNEIKKSDLEKKLGKRVKNEGVF